MSSDTHGPFAAVKRFLAVLLIAWAIVFAYLAFSHSGGSMILLIVAAVVCLAGGVFCARSFAFLQKKEF